MSPVKEKTHGYIPWVIAIAVASFAWYSTYPRAPEWKPKSKQGVDTVYSGDSVYIMKFKVDTAYKLKREIEPKDSPY